MNREIYPLVPGAVPTQTLEDFQFSTSSEIVLDNMEFIPDSPNIVTIKDDTDCFITVIYNTRNGNVIGSLVYDAGDQDHVFPAGSYVSRCFTTHDFEALIDYADTKVPKQHSVEYAGKVLGIGPDGRVTYTTGGGGGTSDYNDLLNKPSINSITLTGNRTSADLGLVEAVEGSSLVPDLKVLSYDTHLINANNPHQVTKAQIGLGNVQNTADLDKPISTAAQAALDLKASAADLESHVEDVDNPHSVTKAQVGLSNVDNTSDLNKPISTATQTALDAKASVTDFNAHTTNKSNPHEVTATQIGVEDGAQVNVIEGIKLNGTDVSLTDKKANIPPASTSSLGVIKVGTNLSIAADGTLSATGGELSQIPADWNQTDSTQPDFIKNKPTSMKNPQSLKITGAVTAQYDGSSEVTVNIPTGGSAAWGDITGDLEDQTDLVEELATKVDKVSGSSLVPDTKVSSYDAHLTNVSNPHSVTASQVGLGNVDNTSDADKPVSSATQTALNAKVDKVTGKGLSTNDYTTDEKTKLAGIASGAEVNVQSNWSETDSSDDSFIKNKPTALSDFTNDLGFQTETQVSSAIGTHNSSTSAHSDIRADISDIETTLGGKVDKVTGSSLVPDTKVTAYDAHIAATNNPHSVTASQVGLGNVDNTSDLNKPVSTATQAAINDKAFSIGSTTIGTADWVSDSTITGFPYKATISNSSITTYHSPIVMLSTASAMSGNICPVSLADNGHVYVYSKTTEICNINRIVFIKG